MTPAAAAAVDPDAQAMRRASRRAGLQITAVFAVLVLLALGATLTFVLTHIKPAHLFTSGKHESTIDIGGLDILIAVSLIGAIVIALTAALSWFVTRRAVRPLGDALRLQRRFVADASHELRTPLAVLDARLQQLQRGLAPDDPSVAKVAELRQDAATLIAIVNDLLATDEDGGAATTVRRPVPLEPIVRFAVGSMQLLADDRSVALEFEVETPAGVRVAAPPASIHRCLVAVLDNALRFSPAGSVIRVSVRGERGRVAIRVTDQGPGITGIHPERVFDRFARGEGSVHDGTGFGIGLALVKDTVERYGGTATVEATGPAGSTLLLRLPRTKRS